MTIYSEHERPILIIEPYQVATPIAAPTTVPADKAIPAKDTTYVPIANAHSPEMPPFTSSIYSKDKLLIIKGFGKIKK